MKDKAFKRGFERVLIKEGSDPSWYSRLGVGGLGGGGLVGLAQYLYNYNQGKIRDAKGRTGAEKGSFAASDKDLKKNVYEKGSKSEKQNLGSASINEMIKNLKGDDNKVIELLLKLYKKQTKGIKDPSDRITILKQMAGGETKLPHSGIQLTGLDNFEQGMRTQLEDTIFDPQNSNLKQMLLKKLEESPDYKQTIEDINKKKQEIKGLHDSLNKSEKDKEGLSLSDIPLAGAGVGGGLGYLIPKLTGLGADKNKETGGYDVPWYLPAVGAGVGALGEYGIKKGFGKSSAFNNKSFVQGFVKGLVSLGITKESNLKMILKSMGCNVKKINFVKESAKVTIPLSNSNPVIPKVTEDAGFGDMVMQMAPQFIAPTVSNLAAKGGKEKQYRGAIRNMILAKFKKDKINKKNYIKMLGLNSRKPMSFEGYVDRLSKAVYAKVNK